jgi:hypothetical protein
MNLRDLSVNNLPVEFTDNRRLRGGLWLILLLVAIWVSLVWSDINSALYNSTKNLGRDLVSLQEIEPVTVWNERSIAAESRVAFHQKAIWNADTPGLATAQLQADLYAFFSEEEKSRLSIKVATPQPLEKYPNLFRIRASIGATLVADQLLKALYNIEANRLRLNVEQLVLKKHGSRWSAALIVTAYFDIPASS